MPIVLDGKACADKICADLAEEVKQFHYVKPRLIIVTSGEDNASNVYVKNKIKRCEEIGIEPIVKHFDCIHSIDIIDVVKERIPIIFQLPMNMSRAGKAAFNNTVVYPLEDVDGFLSDENVAKLATGNAPIQTPCTPMGILRLLQEYNIEVKGKSACIIGRSNIVGRPLACLFENEDATVTLCHSKTPYKKLLAYIENADIIVSATGNRDVLNYYDVKELMQDKILIDVGMNKDENGKLCGDLDRRLYEKSYAYTPVPGGIGPMTVAMLMENTVKYWSIEERIKICRLKT